MEENFKENLEKKTGCEYQRQLNLASASSPTLILNIIIIETSASGTDTVRLRQNEDLYKANLFHEV